MPLRVELGINEIKNKKLTIFRRDINKKETITRKELLKYIENSINDYQIIVEKVLKKESPDIDASGNLLQILRRYVK